MAEIRVELQLADGSFTSGMLRAGQSLAQFQAQLLANNRGLQLAAAHTGRVIDSVTRLDGANKGFVATLRDLSIITGVVSMGIGAVGGAMNGWFGEIVKVNAEMQRLQIMMRGMSRSDDPFREAAENVKYLREMAMNTPFSLQTLANSFVKLQSTGIDPMAGSMQSLADGIAGFGGSDEQFQRATVAITQMSGKGVIQMEELRQQLGEHMPRAVELMARSMGVGVAQLLEEIGKGTVAAKPALEALYAEMDRVYGGRAQAMMQTFDGQMRQTTTLWQNLATTVGGLDLETGAYKEGGFFDTVTKQLRDLNLMLASPASTAFAESVGAGLTSVVLLVRDTISTLITFRREIMTVATIAASAFAFRTAIVGLRGLVSTFGTLRNELKMVKIEFIAAGTTFATGATGMTALSTAGRGATMMLGGMALGVRAVGGAIMTAMPWVGLIGLAVYAAAEYFDIFGNRVSNALEDLKAFGAETRAQAEKVVEDSRAQFEGRIKSAADELDLSRRMMADGIWAFDQEHLNGLEATLENAKAALAQFNEEAPALVLKGADTEDAKAEAEFRQALDRRLEIAQRAYDDQAVLITKDIDARKNGNEMQTELEEERRKRLYDARQEQLEANKDYLEQLANENQLALADAAVDPDLKRKLEDQRAVINAELLQTFDQLDMLKQQGVDGLGIEHLLNPDGGAEGLEAGEKALADIRDEITQMQMELQGASGAMAELNTAIANGDYGSLEQGGQKALELQENLRAATRQKEALDKLMEGRSEAEDDAERARKKALEDQLDLLVERKELEEGRKLTQGEINNMKLELGLYKGLGSDDQINSYLDEITTEFGNIELSAGTAGDAIQNDAFGAETLTALDMMVAKLARVNALMSQTGALGADFNFGQFGASLNGTEFGAQAMEIGNLPEAIADRMSIAMERLMGHGWSQAQAAGIVGNLGGESGLNPNAVNPGDGSDGSDSIGMAQWNAERARALKAFAASQGKQWNDFLTQIDFINHELTGTEGTAGAALRLAGTPEQASETFMRKYERPADWAIQESAPKRAGYALKAFDLGGGSGGATVETLQAENDVLSDRTAILETNGALTLELQGTNDATTQIELENQRNEKLNERTRLLQELSTELGNTSLEAAEAGDALARVYEAIQAGEVGESKDIAAPEYADLIAKAKELDALNKQIAETKDLTTEIDDEAKQIEEERLELNRQLAEAQKAANDPNYTPESSTLRALETRLDAYIENVRARYGEESQIYQQALQTRSNMLGSQLSLEATMEQTKLQQEISQQGNALLTQTQRRQQAMQQQLASVDAWVAKARAAGMEEVEIVRQAEAMKAQIRAQHAQTMNPMGQQMQEWGDLQGQLAQQSTQWMDSLAGGITDLIMGTGDLRSVIQGIVKDMVNMLVKYAMSGMKGGKGAAGGGAAKAGKGAAGGAGKMGGGGAKKMAGVMHAGGIAGGHSFATRRASAAVFAGAPKFHTGGIIGPKLLPSEVPIIAQEGEGVFTAEQMANLSPAGNGGQVITISSPITVNGSAGTPEQNTDLAKKMRREMEIGMRSVVADELRKQTKAGNMMNSRGS